MKKIYLKTALALLAIILLTACDTDTKNFPKDYVGFKDSSKEYTYDLSKEEEILEFKIIAVEKQNEDRRLKISINKSPIIGGAFKLIDESPTIKAGSKEASIKIKIYPKKINRGTFIQLSSVGLWENGSTSRLTIKLIP